jgi:predicted DNA-binding transcriptional regulator YafY
MNTLTRHWHILRMIPFRGRITVTAILHQLANIDPTIQTTRRTIERDLIALQDNFPLVADGEKPQGWYWRKGSTGLDVPGMELTTALSLRMTEEYLTRLLPTNCLNAMAPHFEQAHKVLHETEEGALAHWPEKVKIVPRTQPLLPPRVEPEVMNVVHEALFRNLRFTGLYRRQGEEGKEYEVSPLGLVYSEPIVYLVGTCWKYQDVRLLALHRFSSAALLHDKAVRMPNGFDLQKYIDSGSLGFIQEPGKTLTLQLLFTVETVAHLRESPLTAKQKLTDQSDGRVLLEATVADTQQLRWWLLGFGENVEVVGPAELRAEITDTIRRQGILYGMNS